MIYVLFGLDIEGVHGRDPFEDMILCKHNRLLGGSNLYGATYMAELFSEYNFEATFFIDTIERFMHGESKMKRLCESLALLNQDIQLHTHPSWRFDSRDSKILNNKKRNSFPDQQKDFLYKLTQAEQSKFIKEEKRLLESWSASSVIVHRAGGYGINKDTFQALSENNFKIDASVYYNHPNCKFYPDFGWTDDIYEIPLSTFQSPTGVKRIDIDTTTANQMIDLIESESTKHDGTDTIINVFGHSYSLVTYTNGFKKMTPKKFRIKNLKKILNYLSLNKSVNVVSYSHFYNEVLSDKTKVFHFPLLKTNVPLGWHAKITNSSRLNKSKFFHYLPFIH
jgi:hypothetical protein